MWAFIIRAFEPNDPNALVFTYILLMSKVVCSA